MKRFRGVRAHSNIFRQMQMIVRLARLKDKNPAAYDLAMEQLVGGREVKTDESRRKFLKHSAGAAAGALGLEMVESFYRRAEAAAPAGARPVKVAIIGSGLAGLNCAWQLRKARAFLASHPTHPTVLDVTVYEGRPNRTGGRTFTSQNDVARGMHCELGAEFVDSTNDDMFALVQDQELQDVCLSTFKHELAMLDTGQDLMNPGGTGAPALEFQHLFVRGQHHTLEEAVSIMLPIVRRAVNETLTVNAICDDIIAQSNKTADHHSCGGTGSLGFDNFGKESGVLTHRSNTNLIRLDAMNVRDYFNNVLKIRDTEWIYGYLEAAYTTEYGQPLEAQSALGCAMVMGAQDEAALTASGRLSKKKGTKVDVFGASDERFKIVGGNDKITRCITVALAQEARRAGKPDPIVLDRRLVAVELQNQVVETRRATDRAPQRQDQRANKYRLIFQTSRGQSVTVSDVDMLVLACPLSMLTTVSVNQYTKRSNELTLQQQRGNPRVQLTAQQQAQIAMQLRAEFPRYARINPYEPDYQPSFRTHLPVDLSALGIDQNCPSKALTINSVGYGRNMKVMAGFDQPVWRNQPGGKRYGGYTFSDRPFQMGWDSGQCQDLQTLPMAAQIQDGTPEKGKRPNMTVRVNSRFRKGQLVDGRLNNHLIATGRQFSWFLGGGLTDAERNKTNPPRAQNFAELILADPDLRDFVSHTRDSRGSGGTDVLQAALGFNGDGITNPMYRSGAGTNAKWDAHSKKITSWIDKIVADTDASTQSAYVGFQDSNKRQGAALGYHASSSQIWTNDPFVKGSYLAYLAGVTGPRGEIIQHGQWTRISGMEGAPLTIEGKVAPETESAKWTLFFTGEHCSTEFQGFMNGGAQAGRTAAARMLMALVGSADARAFSPSELVKLYLPTRRNFFVSGLDRIFS